MINYFSIPYLRKASRKVPKNDRFIAFWIAMVASLVMGLFASLLSIFMLPIFMLIFFGFVYGVAMQGFHIKKIQRDHEDEYSKFNWVFNAPVVNAVSRSKKGGLEILPKAILEDESLSEAVFWYKFTNMYFLLFAIVVLLSVSIVFFEWLK